MVTILVAAVVMWIFGNRLLDEAQRANADLPSLGTLVVAQAFFLVATGAALLAESLRYSHRVVGPALRIRRSLQRVRQGDLSVHLVLRKDDELVELADEINALVETLRRDGVMAHAATREAAPAAAERTCRPDSRAVTVPAGGEDEAAR